MHKRRSRMAALQTRGGSPPDRPDPVADAPHGGVATDRFHVITGGPGSGKSTLLEALASRGLATTEEAGRAIIRAETAAGGKALPWADRSAFADAMLDFEIRTHLNARHRSGPVFFDRGVPDVAGYLTLSDLPIPDFVEKACIRYRYAPTVFIAPPWPEIYATDTERRQDLAEAIRTFEAMVATYSRLGYRLVELPRVPVDVRADFVLDRIAAT